MAFDTARGLALRLGTISLLALWVLVGDSARGQSGGIAPPDPPARLVQAPAAGSGSTDLSDLFEEEAGTTPAPILNPPAAENALPGSTPPAWPNPRAAASAPQPTPAQAAPGGAGEMLSVETGEEPVPQPVYQPRRRADQPYSLAGMLDDPQQTDSACDQQHCDQIWECAGGRCMTPWQRCLRNFRRNQSVLWGGNCRTGCGFSSACGNWGCSACGWGLYGGVTDATGCGAAGACDAHSGCAATHQPPSTQFTLTDLTSQSAWGPLDRSAPPGVLPPVLDAAHLPSAAQPLPPVVAPTRGPQVEPAPSRSARRTPTRLAPGVWAW